MTPTRFRRRPQTVEAVQYDGTEESVDLLYEWLGDEGFMTLEVASGRHGLRLAVTLGRQAVELTPDQWLARDGEGRLHVLDPVDMIEDYEIVEGDGDG